MKTLLSLLAVVFVLPSQASNMEDHWVTSDIVKITNDDDRSVVQLSLVKADDEELKGIFIKADWDNKSKCEKIPDEGVFYTKEKLLSEKGATLLRCRGKKVFRLQVKPDPEGGYFVTLKYLHNAIWGKYKKCKMKLSQEPEWKLRYVKTEREVVWMQVKSGSVGVKSVDPDCR